MLHSHWLAEQSYTANVTMVALLLSPEGVWLLHFTHQHWVVCCHCHHYRSVEFPEKASSQSKVEAWVNSTLAEPRDTLTPEDNGRSTGKSDSLIGSYVHKSGLNDYSTDRSGKNSTSSQESRPVARKSSGAKKQQNAVKRGIRRENYREGADESSRGNVHSQCALVQVNKALLKIIRP